MPIFDSTGIEIIPGNPQKCPGSAPKQCCCDECGYFLECYPEWLPDGKEFLKISGSDTANKGGH